jgi:hypothetical protein
VVFGHGKALYFNALGSETVSWDYFRGSEGVYKLDTNTLKYLFDFKYVCFAGLLVKRHFLIQSIRDYRKSKLNLSITLDIYFTFLFFKMGNLYYSNKILSKVREANDYRSSRFPLMVSDAYDIFEFWIKNIFDEGSLIELRDSRLRYFDNSYKVLRRYLYSNEISKVEFQATFTNLSKFEIRQNLSKFLLIYFFKLHFEFFSSFGNKILRVKRFFYERVEL